MRASSTFDAKDYSLESFIQDRAPSLFQVPDYQRRFVWETKHLTDFLDAITKNAPGYYIGTFVVVRSEYRSYDIQVIDGQQRLTSLTFIVKVLIDLLEEHKVILKEENLKFCNDLIYRDGAPRIVFNTDFFNNHLSVLLKEKSPLTIPELREWFHELSSKSQGDQDSFKKEHLLANRKAVTRLFNTYKDIQTYFKDFTAQEIEEVIERMRNLQLIEIVCKDIAVVNDLFEGLNSKGVQLTNAELIKSKLFGRINNLEDSEKIKDSLKSMWEEMDLLFFVEEDKRLIDKFLRHLWISKHGYIVGSKLYDKYVILISELKNAEEAKTFIKELREYAEYYLGIRSLNLNKEHHALLMDPSIYEKFNDFGRLNNDQIYEVLLGLIRIIKEDPGRQLLATRDLKLIFDKFWAFCFRLQFIPVSPSKYETRFAELCVNLKRWKNESNPLASEILTYINTKLALYVKDSELLRENICNQLVYKNSPQNNRMLEKIFYDMFHAYDEDGHKRSTFRYIKPTIEHILPQKCDEWGYRKVEISDFVNNIGNLTLLDEVENNKAANHPFAFKLDTVYARNPFKFNKDLSKYQKGYESSDLLTLSHAIENRAADIAKLLDITYQL